MTATLIHQGGGAVKAVAGKPGWIEGYLVSWGNRQDTDLQGEYFTPDTDFCLDWFGERPCLYHHGMSKDGPDGGPALKAVGAIKTVRADGMGLWVQAQLDLNNQYGQAVYKMVQSQDFGWSSGSVDHLVKIADDGEIKVWPLIEGSVTPTPAQPSKTTVRAFKALFANEEFLRALEARAGDSTSEYSGAFKMAGIKKALQYAKAAAASLGLKLNDEELQAMAAEMESDPALMAEGEDEFATMQDDELDGMMQDDEFGMMADDELDGMMQDDEFATMGDEDIEGIMADEDEFALQADDEYEAQVASYRAALARKAKARKAKARQKALAQLEYEDYQPRRRARKSQDFEPNMGTVDPGTARHIRELNKRIKALEGLEAPGQRAFKTMRIRDEADVPGAYKAVFGLYMRHGELPLSESQRYVLHGKGDTRGWGNPGQVEAVKSADGRWSVKTITGGSDASFGYAVPEDWVNELNKNIAATTVMAPECRTRTTSSDALVQPNLVTTDARRAHAARTRWVSETPAAGDHTATEDTLSQIRIPVHVCMISNPVSMNALEDVGFDIEAELTEAFSEAVGVDYDSFIYAGDGNGKLEGAVTNSLVSGSASAGVQTVGGYIATGSASGFINADAIISMLYHLPAQYRANAKWVMNSNTLRVVSLLKDGNGNYLMGDRNEGLRGATIPDTLMSKPILVNEYATDIAANVFPVAIGDWRRGYTVAKRVDFAVKRYDDSNYAELNQVLFLGRARLGGQVVQPAAFKVLKVAVS